MSNTLTGLVPTIYQGLQVVSRENVGAIQAVNRNTSAEAAALGQTISTPIVPSTTTSDIVPSMAPTDSGGQIITHKDFTISKSKKAEVLWTGEEVVGTSQYAKILQDQFAAAFRAISNEVADDIVAKAIAEGTGSATVAALPVFSDGNTMSDVAAVGKAMRDAGLDGQKRNFVLDSAAQANLQSTPNLFKVNESGSVGVVQDGTIGRLGGLDFYSQATTADSFACVPSAIQLVARTPAGGMNDGASDSMVVQDAKSGLNFLVQLWKGYHQQKIEISLAWGVGIVAPENIILLSV